MSNRFRVTHLALSMCITANAFVAPAVACKSYTMSGVDKVLGAVESAVVWTGKKTYGAAVATGRNLRTELDLSMTNPDRSSRWLAKWAVLGLGAAGLTIASALGAPVLGVGIGAATAAPLIADFFQAMAPSIFSSTAMAGALPQSILVSGCGFIPGWAALVGVGVSGMALNVAVDAAFPGADRDMRLWPHHELNR